jgi:predicted phosphoribosyltransferase
MRIGFEDLLLARFKDRYEAGRELAEALAQHKKEDVVIYALPRGGVILGYEVAKRLEAPLEVIITRKVGHPFSPEYGICAVAEDGCITCNEKEVAYIDPTWFKEEVERERHEARRRREAYLRGHTPVSAKGKTVILVDDGVATGLTFLLSIKELKHQEPKRIIAAIPVAPLTAAEKIRTEVDELVALDVPRHFLGAVGAYYEEFPPVEDEEVIEVLEKARSIQTPLHGKM